MAAALILVCTNFDCIWVTPVEDRAIAYRDLVGHLITDHNMALPDAQHEACFAQTCPGTGVSVAA